MESNSLVAQENTTIAASGNAPHGDRVEDNSLVQVEEVGHSQFITFTVGKQEYGVDIMSVREVK
ncbi:hypothetical protein [Kiloniella sp.]|uniref:hypothetical protein n=1 Tax=Kiloniella sp. TaxID=1938587 RepID=UPI003B011B05